MLAVVGFEIRFFVATRTPSIFAFTLRFINHRSRHNTSGNCNDGVTKNHNDTRQEASHDSDRSDVAITNSSKGDNRPVDAGADVCELRVRLCSFDDEHQRTNDGDEDEDEEEIDKYLPETHTDALEKQIAFVDEREELEHTENTKKSEYTQDEEVACG